jgi:hypothetical protein
MPSSFIAQPVISQPDISQDDLSNTISAANSVTNYAQAVVTAVPRITQPPAWYVPISDHLQAAQAHAQNWISNICPAVSNNIPQSIVDFNSTFSNDCQILLITLQAINNEPQSYPTAAQRNTVASNMADILSNIKHQQAVVAAAQKAVLDYATELNNDQNTLAADLNTVASKFTSGQASVSQMQATIGESFLDSSTLGPCNVIVNIDMNISFKVASLNLDETIITTVYAQAILQNQIGNTQAAQRAVQTIVDAWSILVQKYTAVISDLNDAADDEYAAMLAQLDLQTAQQQWQQLSDFAQTLISQ